MAAGGMLVRQGIASSISISVIALVDRRPSAPVEPTVWAFQRQVEVALYANDQTSGAMYRLLHRSGVGPRALPLKKSCISDGLVTQAEFDWIHDHLGGGVRSFTLVPLDALQTAIDHSTHSGSVHWLDSAQWALPAYTGTGSKSAVSKLTIYCRASSTG
jgi:hypothetical protein